MMRPRGGMALIIVLGVLGVLAILAVTFVSVAQLERKASQQRTSTTKAFLLARSGIEDVLARLSAGQDPTTVGTRYFGEDWDTDGALSPGSESSAQLFNRAALDVESCPLRCALRPTFAKMQGGYPDLMKVSGLWRGFSGALSSDSIRLSNHFLIRVEDESGKINVNGSAGWIAQLPRILNILGSRPQINLPTLGTDVQAFRPPGGYTSIAQLQQRIGQPSKDLSPYLTTLSWSDTKVVRPNGVAGQAAPLHGEMNEVKKGRSQLSLEPGGRPPVNLNTAPGPVLIALIQGLQGTTWQSPAMPVTDQVTATMASDIAGAILDFRAGKDPLGWYAAAGLVPGPFTSRGQFGVFCDALVGPAPHPIRSGFSTLGGQLAMADLVKSNFDPNTDLNKQMPDQLMFRWVDKSDLIVWSTEGNIGPTGMFKVSAVGRVLGMNGEPRAECLLTSTVENFRFLRQTTQKDFVCDASGATRKPDNTPTSYLTLADPAEGITTGAHAGASWWGPGGNPGAQPETGLAVITYPNPMPALAVGNACDLDGSVALATVELKEDLGVYSFLHHLNDTWDGQDLSTGSPRSAVYGAHDGKLQTDMRVGIWPSAGTEPSTLCPDGLFTQWERAPGFQAKGNLPPVIHVAGPPAHDYNRAVFSYWLKDSVFFSGDSGPLTGQASLLDLSLVRWAGGLTQSMMLGRNVNGDGSWGIMAENSPGAVANQDDSYERQFMIETLTDPGSYTLKPGQRWRLVTAWFNTASVDQGSDTHIDVRGALPNYSQDNIFNQYTDGVTAGPYNPTICSDLYPTVDIPFVLGGNSSEVGDIWSYAMLDELAVFDLGEPSNADVQAPMMAGQRFADGRYYKGDHTSKLAGSFLSSILEPVPSGRCRLLNTQWTAYFPNERRMEEYQSGAFFYLPRTVDGFLVYPDGRSRLSLAVDLMDAAGTGLLAPLTQGAPLGQEIGRFRYRVSFQNDLQNFPGNPVLETPCFDDITLAWQPVTGPRILSWERP